jgi:hypothetical protein
MIFIKKVLDPMDNSYNGLNILETAKIEVTKAMFK